MRIPRAEEIDAVAETIARDIRNLCAIWHMRGSAALDTAVRGDANFSFAVLDARSGGGAVRLMAMRPSSKALLTFGKTTDGERLAVAYGLDDFCGCTLIADPALDLVEVRSGANPAWSNDEKPPGALAFELSWRFDVAVSQSAPVPANYNLLPAEFAGGVDPTIQIPALLAIVDGAASALEGRTSYSDSLNVITGQRERCGLPERDSDLWGIYCISDQGGSDLDYGFELRRKESGGVWTWAQELAKFEEFAHKHGEPHCRSLIARFRGNSFADQA